MTENTFDRAAKRAREAANLAHAVSIGEARTPLGALAQDVEDVGTAFARMCDRLRRSVAARDRAKLVAECKHPPEALRDLRLLETDPLTYWDCSRCGQMVCAEIDCRHRVGQHSDNGCNVEGCECPASHK